MKNAFRARRTYLVAMILLVIGFAISYGIFWLTYYFSLENPGVVAWDWHFVMLAFGFLFILAGFIIREYHAGKYRKKVGDYAGKLPQEIKDKMWASSLGALIGGIFIIVFVGIIELVILIIVSTGYIPPLGL